MCLPRCAWEARCTPGWRRADDLAARVEQRAAGIPWIQRGIRLDDVGDQAARACAHAAAQRTDDARGDGLLEPERIADGDRDLAAAQVR